MLGEIETDVHREIEQVMINRFNSINNGQNVIKAYCSPEEYKETAKK